MGTKLEKAPVCLTIAQVCFSEMLKLKSQLPEIQDKFREIGFPIYKSEQLQEFEYGPEREGSAHLSVNKRTRYRFSNRKETAAFLLDHRSLTYLLSDYPVFDTFAKQFGDGMKIIQENLSLEVAERLGMRMLDAIQPLQSERIEQYLIPEALGLSNHLNLGLPHQQTLIESVFSDIDRSVVMRAVRLLEGIALPPDLLPLRVKLDARFTEHRGETVMLDCDSSSTSRVDFDVRSLLERLRELKSALTCCFTAIVTPYALDSWK